MRKFIAFFLIISLVSCKSKQVLLESDASGNKTADSIIKSHYSNKKDFSTLYIKANAKYKDDKQSQSVTAEIRIKNNEKILVSVRFLGITMAKALITPTEVKYYEKLGGKYFEGNYAALSQWLGTDLDYNKVQNMLLGYAFDDLNKSKYDVSIVEKMFKLADKKNQTTQKNYYFEAENFALKRQEIIQPNDNRMLQINYNEYHKVDDVIFPLNYKIEATQDKGKNTIEIDYKNITINDDLSFPYSVPDGYDRIYIEK
jgi:hypothetical protein